MSRFKSIAWPAPSKGSTTPEPKAVVPNLAMSLMEIIERFTRGEPLEIGRDGASYDDGPDDLEKVSTMDLVDKEEYIEKLKATQKRYTDQEKKRELKRQEELDRLAVEALMAQKRASEVSDPKPPAK